MENEKLEVLSQKTIAVLTKLLELQGLENPNPAIGALLANASPEARATIYSDQRLAEMAKIHTDELGKIKMEMWQNLWTREDSNL